MLCFPKYTTQRKCFFARIIINDVIADFDVLAKTAQARGESVVVGRIPFPSYADDLVIFTKLNGASVRA